MRPATPSYSDVTLAIQDTLHPPASVTPQRRSPRSVTGCRCSRTEGCTDGRRRRHRQAGKPTDGSALGPDRPRQGRAQARLHAVRARGARDGARRGLPDPLRVLPLAAARGPALPGRRRVRRPLELRHRAAVQHLVVGLREHGDHHRHLGRARARARHADRAGHVPRDLRPHGDPRVGAGAVRRRHRRRRVRLAARVRPGDRASP